MRRSYIHDKVEELIMVLLDQVIDIVQAEQESFLERLNPQL